MSKYTGGIFSKARGATGDIVFSAARDRQGKPMTSRNRTIPLQPNTPAQVSSRDNFRDTLNIVRSLGVDFYRQDWNRSVSKLPGYQSLFSILQNAKEVQGTDVVVTATPVRTPLGVLDPTTYSVIKGSPNEFEVRWDPVATGNQQSTDVAICFAIVGTYPVASIPSLRLLEGTIWPGTVNRSAGVHFFDSGGFPGSPSGALIALYFRPGTGSPVLSPSEAIWTLAP